MKKDIALLTSVVHLQVQLGRKDPSTGAYEYGMRVLTPNDPTCGGRFDLILIAPAPRWYDYNQRVSYERWALDIAVTTKKPGGRIAWL